MDIDMELLKYLQEKEWPSELANGMIGFGDTDFAKLRNITPDDITDEQIQKYLDSREEE